MTSTLVSQRIEAILGPLTETRARLKEERADLIQRREDKDREIAKIDKVLRAAGLEPMPQPAARKANKSKSSKQVAPATLARVRAEVEAVAARKEPFTQGDVIVEGLSGGTVSNAFATFREQGVIRLVGRGGREIRGAYLYALMSKATED